MSTLLPLLCWQRFFSRSIGPCSMLSSDTDESLRVGEFFGPRIMSGVQGMCQLWEHPKMQPGTVQDRGIDGCCVSGSGHVLGHKSSGFRALSE